MCEVQAPQHFIRVKYKTKCYHCECAEAYYLLIPKCGPLTSAESVRGSHFVAIYDIKCIDDFEIECTLREKEVGPIELEEYDDHWVPDFPLCQAEQWECGVLNSDQLNTGRLMFEELNRQLATINL